jgi:NAD(P)-dependent dehydrogenase (short-subunit alcohol dehydrogenase family)
LTDQVVVTGAAGGLGSAVVRRYVEQGYDVVALDLTAIGPSPRVTSYQVDVTSGEQLRSALGDVGPVQHLAMLAGGALQKEKTTSDLLDLDVEVFRRSLELNLVSTFLTVQACLPNMRASSGDRTVTFTTSTDAVLSYGLPAYAAAKSGIIGMVHALSDPLGAEGIRINAVAPGDIPTPRNAKEWAHRPSWYQDLAAATPLRRLASPEDVANTFVALATALRATTGQVVFADAGIVGGRVIKS